MILCLHVTLVGLLMSLLFNVAIARLWLAYPRAVVSIAQASTAGCSQT
ncbi:hypothetical protein ABZ559_05415 [Streptococcus sp. ZY19097]